MKSKPANILAGILAAMLASWGTRHVIDLLREEPEVAQEVVERAWEQESVGHLSFNAPWSLQPRQLTFPPEVAALFKETTSEFREENGLTIMATHSSFVDGVAPSLDGGVASAESSMRAEPDTRSVQFTRADITFEGGPAVEYTAIVARERGKPLTFHGLVVVKGSDLYQVVLAHRADQTSGMAAWRKLLASAELNH